MTGHDNGVITLNIDEADEAERVKHKTDLEKDIEPCSVTFVMR